MSNDSIVKITENLSEVSLEDHKESEEEEMTNIKELLSTLTQKSFSFWDSQPVASVEDATSVQNIADSAPIETKTVAEVKTKPLALLAGFSFVTLDLTKPDTADMQDVYDLLYNHYVEDDDNMFRFDYSKEFLSWALSCHGFIQDWHIGVRADKSGKLCAMITAVPVRVRVHDKWMDMAEVNFLCIHKKLRSHRLAPVLIREVTRRVNLTDRWQALYTAGVVLPTPVASCLYWHRSLNIKKLVDVGFTRLAPKLTMKRAIKFYSMPKEAQVPGVRRMEARDVKAVTKLLSTYLSKFSLVHEFSEDDVRHWMLPREGVVSSFVITEPEDESVVTDFFSYYSLPSSVIGNTRYSTLNIAYMFYYVPNVYSVKEILNEALIKAAAEGFDVFNALELMDNGPVLKELEFGEGDGKLQFYVYNYKTKPMPSGQVGVVML